MNSERELHRDQKEDLEPSPIHKQIANVLIVRPAVVIHTVVQDQEGSWVKLGGHTTVLLLHDFLHNELLTFDEVGEDHRVVFAMNKDGRDHLFEKSVTLLCPRNHSTEGHILMVK